MTIQQFESGKELMRKTKELQEFQKAFHEPYFNSIRACAYEGRVEKTKTLSIDKDDELYKIIDDYVDRRLADLQKQFAAV